MSRTSSHSSKRNYRHGGPRYTMAQAITAVELRAEGKTYSEIANAIGVSSAGHVSRVVRQFTAEWGS